MICLYTWGEVSGSAAAFLWKKSPVAGGINQCCSIAPLACWVHAGALGLSLWDRSLGLCQPLTTLQLEAPSSQWDDSLEIKTQPTDSFQELVTTIHSQSSVAI